MWYALGVGNGWVELRQAKSAPKIVLTKVNLGDRLYSIRTFKGGTSRAVVRLELMRSRISKGVVTGVKRITEAEAKQVLK